MSRIRVGIEFCLEDALLPGHAFGETLFLEKEEFTAQSYGHRRSRVELKFQEDGVVICRSLRLRFHELPGQFSYPGYGWMSGWKAKYKVSLDGKLQVHDLTDLPAESATLPLTNEESRTIVLTREFVGLGAEAERMEAAWTVTEDLEDHFTPDEMAATFAACPKGPVGLVTINMEQDGPIPTVTCTNLAGDDICFFEIDGQITFGNLRADVEAQLGPSVLMTQGAEVIQKACDNTRLADFFEEMIGNLSLSCPAVAA